MKKLLLILLCLPMIGFGQDNCGTIPTQQQIDYLNQTQSPKANQIINNWDNWKGRFKVIVPHSEKAKVGLENKEEIKV